MGVLTTPLEIKTVVTPGVIEEFATDTAPPAVVVI
jgi:hypothetical protein